MVPSFSLSFKYKLPVFLFIMSTEIMGKQVLGTLSGEILEVLVMGRLNPKFVGPWEGEEWRLSVYVDSLSLVGIPYGVSGRVKPH